MNSILVIYLLLAIFCGSTEFEQSVSVSSSSVYPAAVFYVKNESCVNDVIVGGCGVNAHLTWELAFNNSFQHLFSVSYTLVTSGVKGQSCPSFVDQWIFIMRVTSVEVPLNTLETRNVHVFCDPAEDWNFCRVRKKLYGGNTRTYYISSSRREKRCFRVKYAFRSVEPGYREERAQDRFELTLNYLFQVVLVFTVECFVECVIMYGIPCFFYGILSLFECFMAAVIAVIYASLHTSY